MSTSSPSATITGTDLLAFLHREGLAGRMHQGTASTRRSAVREVLARAVPDPGVDPLEFPFTAVDVDDLCVEFSQAVEDDFELGTIRSYRSNFSRTVALYVEALDVREDLGDALVEYRFPVRQGVTAELRLPRDLTRAEAERLARLVENLPVENA